LKRQRKEHRVYYGRLKISDQYTEDMYRGTFESLFVPKTPQNGRDVDASTKVYKEEPMWIDWTETTQSVAAATDNHASSSSSSNLSTLDKHSNTSLQSLYAVKFGNKPPRMRAEVCSYKKSSC
jgi:hypothetical protein